MISPGLASAVLSNSEVRNPWAYVTRRFKSLQVNLAPTPAVIDDANKKLAGVISSLNRFYRNENTISHHILAGSWGKNTVVHPPTDVDVCFILPNEVFHQFASRSGNQQSQLLQHVKSVLESTYPQTAMRGDGQVVVVDFNSITIEVVPSFVRRERGLITCDTHDGGSWKLVDPLAEAVLLDHSDKALRGNHRKIARILKQWKRHCNVDIKSFHIEQLVGEALPKLSWGSNDEFWFDWIIRDVLRYMITRSGGGFYMPGGFNEWVSLGDAWCTKAEIAHARAQAACRYEHDNMNLSAGNEWQKIFGPKIPEMVI